MKNRSPHPILAMGIMLALIAVTGCEEWVGEVPTIAALPTLTPSPVPTVTPPVGQVVDEALSPMVTATITLTPAETPTPPLWATSTPSSTEAALAATVTARAPVIIYFAATPEEVAPGETILLFWSAQNGTEAAIYRLNQDGTPGRTWSEDLEGSLAVTPQTVGRPEVYVLAVTNGITTVERRVTVNVTCPYTWFFSPAPANSCPQGEPSTSPAVVQQLEHGRMFWIAVTDQIIVLFDDFPTSASQSNPAWIMVADPYVDGDPDSDPSIVPPEGFFQPVRGFGQVWRSTSSIRERLGWAISGEMPYVTTYQSTQVDDTTQLYFTDPAGQAITLIPGGEGWLVAGYVTP